MIITYDQHYEAELLRLWNRCMTADQITARGFRHQVLLDDNFDAQLCYLYFERDTLCGFLLATKRKFPYLERGLEQDRGWINVMFVDSKVRRQGVGTKLVQRAEADLKARGAKNITLAAYSPNYFFPGVDLEAYAEAVPFFGTLGYQAAKESWSMCKDLHGYEIAPETLEEVRIAEDKGFRFQMFDYLYAVELLDFARDEFGGGWKRNCLLTMQNDRAEDCIFLVLDSQERICGFCTRMIDGDPSRFGPIGVARRVRDLGLGGILFDLYQAEMVKRSIYNLYFKSTDMPGRRFYERHGVHVFRSYVEMRKIICE